LLKVKAVWKVGYPPEDDKKKIYTKGITFVCDNDWGEKKAEEGKVKIIAELEDEIYNTVDIKKIRTKDDLSFIEECKDHKKLNKWFEDEKKGENRKTIINLIKDRLAELKEGDI